MKFKTGDWVLHDFKLKVIRDMEDGRVTSVSDGHFITGGMNLRCFPLTMRNKIIMDSVRYYYDELYKAEGQRNLNWPDVHRFFEGVFEDACSLPEKPLDKEDPRLKKYFDKLRDFYMDTLEILESSRQRTVQGVHIIGR